MTIRDFFCMLRLHEPVTRPDGTKYCANCRKELS